MNNAAFSKAELKEANVPLAKLLFNGFRMDVRRKTMHAENVEILKKLELKDPPAKKPKVKKEKKAKPVKAAAKTEEKAPAAASPAKKTKVTIKKTKTAEK
jgi:hypothetical protein